MKRFFVIPLILIFELVSSACGSTPAEPTMSAEEIQATAVSAAFTIVAETQAAIPTNTPVPPTNTPEPTPLPTETLVPSPTLEALAVPTFTVVPTTASNNNNGGDPCNKPLPGGITGHDTKIKLVNKTKGSLVVSLYLNLTPFGECGYRGYNLAKNDAITITDLVTGCYNLYVWVTEPNSSSTATGGGCINNPDLWTFEIYSDNVKFVGP